MIHYKQPTIVLGEVGARESQTIVRISVLLCQRATDFFTKTSPKRLAITEKYGPLHFRKGYFSIFLQF